MRRQERRSAGMVAYLEWSSAYGVQTRNNTSLLTWRWHSWGPHTRRHRTIRWERGRTWRSHHTRRWERRAGYNKK